MRFFTNEVYHVYNRSVNHELLFQRNEHYHFFLRRFNEYVLPEIQLYAYCLMPTHFHFMVGTKEDTQKLGTAFTKLFISYSKAINKECERHGSLFQNRYKKKWVDSEAYFSNVIRYIHQNPVEAGLCTTHEEWDFSSYRSIISNSHTNLEREEVLDWFGGLSNFTEYHSLKENSNWVLKNLPGH